MSFSDFKYIIVLNSHIFLKIFENTSRQATPFTSEGCGSPIRDAPPHLTS